MRLTEILVRSLVGVLLPLFCVVDPETSNGLMPAAGKLMTLSRMLIIPGLEHTAQIIGVDLCLLVLRPRGSMVLQGSHIMNAPEILRSTSLVQISGGRNVTLCLWCEAVYSSSLGARRWFGGGFY